LHSRAYLSFADINSLQQFIKAYQGHVFQDSKGTQYQALVELAPFQKFVTFEKKRKLDHRFNTIEDDEMFKAFIQSLDEVKIEEAVEVAETPKSTPLVDALRRDAAARAANRARKKEQKSESGKASGYQSRNQNSDSRQISGNRQASRTQSESGNQENSLDGKKKKRNRKKKDDDSSRDGPSKDGLKRIEPSKDSKERPRLVLQTRDGTITKLDLS
jgi:ribosomal protein L12E/L44/L45/RPP1/RPP2